jgi:L-histidine N-alpha-methyltransferase
VTTPTVDVHLQPDDLSAALRTDVLDGLTSSPKELPPKYFYDDRGSRLFDDITRLPEYYPTRCEREILERCAGRIIEASGCDTLIELGSGTSEKTRLLLDAGVGSRSLRRFVPFDVSETTLRGAAADIAREYPSLSVHGVVGDFDHHLGLLPAGGRRLVAFLGGTIGNLNPSERKRFFAELVSGFEPGDGLLLGTDLIKDVGRLEAAYDDSAGVTAEFNRNVLLVVNDALGADFDPVRFQHVAFFDLDNEWIEMRLRSRSTHVVTVAGCDGLQVAFEAGEEMRTEISAKFRRPGVESELNAVGLDLVEWWTDSAEDFALSLSVMR